MTTFCATQKGFCAKKKAQKITLKNNDLNPYIYLCVFIIIILINSLSLCVFSITLGGAAQKTQKAQKLVPPWFFFCAVTQKSEHKLHV